MADVVLGNAGIPASFADRAGFAARKRIDRDC
jgi:hypothetical protein